MTKCHQCDRPAFFRVSEQEVPLCLSCYATWHHTQSIDFLKNAALMNHAMDEMDAVTGIYSQGGRIPIVHIARAIQGSPTLNNFVISQSQIGVLNTGSIKKIDAAITLARGSDSEPVAEQIKALTETIIGSDELGPEIKNEVIELTEAIAEEIVTKRRLTSITALMKDLREKLSGTLALSSAAEKLWAAIQSAFLG